jgi:methionine synthase II (cobalamin-independent)
MTHRFDCMATGIGSLPLLDPDAAVALALRWLPEAPFWPQLPRLGFREQMGSQYAAAWPGVVVDEARERVWIDTARDLSTELGAFYERYLARDLEHFALAERDAAGFHALLRALGRTPPAQARFLKGHVTGPLTAGVMCKDAGGRDIIHDEQLFDAVVKGLAMNAAWQVRRLGAFGRPVIIFIDEPAMETLGSAFAPASAAEIAERLDEVVDAIHEAGGLAGIHCCGNADWPMIFGTRADIVNFDAYAYLERVLLQPEAIRAFLGRGGALAWGIVPTGSFTGAETVDGLVERLEEGLGRLAAAGIPRATLLRQAIVTPSCGMGSLAPAAAEAILRLNLEVSGRMRAKIR